MIRYECILDTDSYCHSCCVWSYSGVINLKADVEAETGKRYTSQKTWKLDIEEWEHSNRA